MKFDYNNIPDKTKLVPVVDHKKILGVAKDVNLSDPDLFNKMEILGWKMVKACLAGNGLGCAAPQLGVLKKCFVMVDFQQPDIWRFAGSISLYINPTMKHVPKSERATGPEGCLSVPGRKQLLVARPRDVEVSYWYFNEKAKLVQNTREILTGHPSRIFQNQYDHLYGMDIVQLNARQNVKPKRGRPKGSKNSKKSVND